MLIAPTNSRGFTVIELMISTAVFSTVALVVTAGVLTFTHQYYKGVTSNRTQVTVNSIMAQITHDIQFSNSPVDLTYLAPHPGTGGSGDIGCFQIGNDLYAYQTGAELQTSPQANVNQYRQALIVAPAAAGQNCNNGSGAALTPATLAGYSGAHELLSPGMRLSALNIVNNSTGYQVSLRLLSGDDDLLSPAVSGNASNTNPIDWAHEGCNQNTGNEYCGYAGLQTSVAQRL